MIFRSPAKVNLGLEILRRRGDGFHDLSSIMLAIDLCDHIEVLSGEELVNAQQCEEFSRTGLTDRALDAFSAVTRFKVTFGSGVRKTIPVAAGLGGGSSNAATALLAANSICEHPISDSDLSEVACEVGSDVPFFLSGGCALLSGRGEVRDRELPIANVWIVLANPGIALSTPDVFGEICSDEFTSGARTWELAESIAASQPQWDLLYNGLQAAALRLCPPIRATLDAIGAHTPWTLLSGSGATCFGILESEEAARAAAEDLARSGYWAWAGRPLESWTLSDLMI